MNIVTVVIQAPPYQLNNKMLASCFKESDQVSIF